MMNKQCMRGVAALGLQGPVPCVLALGVALSACTLTTDSFEPALVTGESEAAVLDGSTPPLGEDVVAAARACTGDGSAGIGVIGGDSSCSGAIELLPSAARSEPDVGSPASLDAPISLPPCPDEGSPFEAAELVLGLDFDEDMFGPALSTDGRTLYFSAYVSGEQQIFAATRDERGRTFESARELPVVNSPASDGSPFLSADGARLYLFSERAGGLGQRDVWISQWQNGEGRFAEPRLLASINSPETDLLPWLSLDELSLIFVSDRPGGRGGADLWEATRGAVDDDFDAPTHLAELSSGRNEGRAVLTSDGLTAFFSSDRGGGLGGADLWVATREHGQQPFSSPRNLASLNSDANEQDVALSSDADELFFASSRGGVSQLWQAARSCE